MLCWSMLTLFPLFPTLNQVVSLHCNLDKNTRHLINEEKLKIMKPNAVLVNAARGPVIDEAALVRHLKANPEFRWVLHVSAIVIQE